MFVTPEEYDAFLPFYDPALNGNRSLADLKGSDRVVWLCPIPCEHGEYHTWSSLLRGRVRRNAQCQKHGDAKWKSEVCCAMGSFGFLNPSAVAEATDKTVDWMTVLTGSNAKYEFCCGKSCAHGVPHPPWKAKVKNRMRGRGCPYCAMNRVFCSQCCTAGLDCATDCVSHTIEQLGRIPRSSNVKLLWRCRECSGEYMASPKVMSDGGNKCPTCVKKQSDAESNMEKAIQAKQLVYEKEVPIWMTGRRCPLRLDFMAEIPGFGNAVIETDGKQHFVPMSFCSCKGKLIVRHGKKTYEKAMQEYKIRRKNDGHKDHYCKVKRLPLMRVSFDVKYEDYPEWLEKFIAYVLKDPEYAIAHPFYAGKAYYKNGYFTYDRCELYFGCD